MRPAGISSPVGGEQTMQDEHGWLGALLILYDWVEASAGKATFLRISTVLGTVGPTMMRTREEFEIYREERTNRSMLILLKKK